jgi:hypothetical protein
MVRSLRRDLIREISCPTLSTSKGIVSDFAVRLCEFQVGIQCSVFRRATCSVCSVAEMAISAKGGLLH